MKKLQKTLLNPISISLLITLIVAYFWIDRLYPLKMELIESNSSTRYLDVFCDTDNDGTTENIEFWSEPTPYFTLENEDGSIRYALSIYGKEYIGQNKNIFHDCDKDGNKEMIVFSYTGDSVFLNIYSLLDKRESTLNSYQFIHTDNFSIVNGTPECRINDTWFYDFNGDGCDEVIFTQMAGFSVSPRRVYMYDIKSQKLNKSIDLGTKGVISGVENIDNSGNSEILFGTGDVNNCSDTCTLPFPDTCAYFIAFNHKLELKFTPVPCKLNRAFADIFYFKNQDKIIASAYTGYPHKTEYSEAKLKNNTFQLIELKSQDFYILPICGYEYEYYGQPVFYNTDTKQFLYLTQNLNFIELFTCKFSIAHLITQNEKFDFDEDGINDLFFQTSNDELLLLSINQKKELALYDITSSGKDGFRLLSVKPIDDYWVLQLHEQFKRNTLIKLFKNPLYAWRYPIIAAVFIVLCVLLFSIDMFFKYRLKKSLEIRHKLQELQLLNSKSQISPHFLFNALNSISSLIYKEDKEKAYDYITRFSKLHRSLLENSDQVFISLQEELEFLENYLILQKLRYKERLEYEILCDENVNKQINVPKMLVQGYVENAIKHGISARNEGGKVSIIVSQINNLQIIVEDNGIGMYAASKIKNRNDSTGKGMRINRQIFDLLEDLYNYKIKFRIENFDKVKNVGTRIILELPVK